MTTRIYGGVLVQPLLLQPLQEFPETQDVSLGNVKKNSHIASSIWLLHMPGNEIVLYRLLFSLIRFQLHGISPTL